VFDRADQEEGAGQTSGIPPLAEKIAEVTFATCPPPIWSVSSTDRDAAPRARAGTVTESVTRRTLSGGAAMEPLEGETPSAKAPPGVAAQFRFAGAPFARSVISMEWVEPGANEALGRRAVTDRGGIQPVPAFAGAWIAPASSGTSASVSAGCGNRARMFLGGYEAGAGRTHRPPTFACFGPRGDYLRIVMPTLCENSPASIRA